MKNKAFKHLILNRIKSIVTRRKKQYGKISLGAKELEQYVNPKNNVYVIKNAPGRTIGIFGKYNTYRTGLMMRCFHGLIESNIPIKINGKKPAIYVLTEDSSKYNINYWISGKFIGRKITRKQEEKNYTKMKRLGFVVKFLAPGLFSYLLNDTQTTYPYAVFIDEMLSFNSTSNLRNDVFALQYIRKLRDLSIFTVFTSLENRSGTLKTDYLQYCDIGLITERNKNSIRSEINIHCVKSRGISNYKKLDKMDSTISIDKPFKYTKYA